MQLFVPCATLTCAENRLLWYFKMHSKGQPGSVWIFGVYIYNVYSRQPSHFFSVLACVFLLFVNMFVFFVPNCTLSQKYFKHFICTFNVAQKMYWLVRRHLLMAYSWATSVCLFGTVDRQVQSLAFIYALVLIPAIVAILWKHCVNVAKRYEQWTIFLWSLKPNDVMCSQWNVGSWPRFRGLPVALLSCC